uniref:(northern house mosquito) hypothetical protein n=1 Tax=Culex pipiens TaxID=7175 RepID=A0A8D8JPY0_CULPI
MEFAFSTTTAVEPRPISWIRLKSVKVTSIRIGIQSVLQSSCLGKCTLTAVIVHIVSVYLYSCSKQVILLDNSTSYIDGSRIDGASQNWWLQNVHHYSSGNTSVCNVCSQRSCILLARARNYIYIFVQSLDNHWIKIRIVHLGEYRETSTKKLTQLFKCTVIRCLINSIDRRITP